MSFVVHLQRTFRLFEETKHDPYPYRLRFTTTTTVVVLENVLRVSLLLLLAKKITHNNPDVTARVFLRAGLTRAHTEKGEIRSTGKERGGKTTSTRKYFVLLQ